MKLNTIVDITRQLITFKTISTDHKTIVEALEHVKSVLKPSIQTKILFNQNTPILWAATREFTSPDVLLLCHIDVVKAEESDFVPTISKGKIIGRGAGDMKGSLAAMIEPCQGFGPGSNPGQRSLF